MIEIPWIPDYKYHMNGSVKGELHFTAQEEELVRKNWTEDLQPFAERIVAEGGVIRAYYVADGHKIRPEVEGISQELRDQIAAAGLRI